LVADGVNQVGAFGQPFYFQLAVIGADIFRLL
jgi:hypothetical protein